MAHLAGKVAISVETLEQAGSRSRADGHGLDFVRSRAAERWSSELN